MRSRRPLLAAVLAGAVLLVVGRAVAFLYTEHVWYSSLGATSVWAERVTSTVILTTVTFVAAAAFAFANFSAVRHSILSLVVPRRLGNVEFAEAISPRRLDAVVLLIAVVVALLAGSAAPDWTSLGVVRTGVRFAETEPYHHLDLSYYTAWLPLEMELHTWVWVVVLSVVLVVTLLYALTPGLRWENGAVRMTAYVRRHLAVLVAVMLVLLAWRARLRTYTLLFDGSGPDGAFTALDHAWLMPAHVVLSIVTVAAAGAFVWAMWGRQLTIATVTLGAVLFAWLLVHQVLPVVAGSPAPAAGAAARSEAPYAATREAFTRRAFDGVDDDPENDRHPGTVLTRSVRVVRATRLAHVAPGARGYLVVADSQQRIPAPAVGSFGSRLAHAWREQDARLFGGGLPRHARILRVRDVERRVERLAPLFTQGTRHAALFRADTLYWVTDLYTASNTYPLARRAIIGGERRGYFQHAATAFTNASTGAVTIVADPAPDAIARAWLAKFPRNMIAARRAPAWTHELTLEPAAVPLPRAGESDSVFRARVRALYLRMRAALSTSDLVEFGRALDSLGAAVGVDTGATR